MNKVKSLLSAVVTGGILMTSGGTAFMGIWYGVLRPKFTFLD